VAVTSSGTLPYTGTDTTGLVAAGVAIVAGGLVLVGLARTKKQAGEL
jgi:LPXTG-motif cell wall-anchored protein